MKPTRLSLMAILAFPLIFSFSVYAQTEKPKPGRYDLIKMTRKQAQCMLTNKEIYQAVDRALVFIEPEACPRIGKQEFIDYALRDRKSHDEFMVGSEEKYSASDAMKKGKGFFANTAGSIALDSSLESALEDSVSRSRLANRPAGIWLRTKEIPCLLKRIESILNATQTSQPATIELTRGCDNDK